MYRVFVGRYSNVSRFGANLVGFFLVLICEQIKIYDFPLLFFGFFLVLICKQIKIYDFFDPHLLVDPASEKPGIEKSSISFKFLLKIDDFRRRVDSEKPGMHFLSRSV